MAPLPFKDRLRGSFYAGFTGILLSIPCTWLALEVCFCAVPSRGYTPGQAFTDFIFNAKFRDPEVILWELLNGLAAAMIYFIVPSAGVQKQMSVPFHGRVILDSLKLAGPCLLLSLVWWKPTSLHDIINLIPESLTFISPTLFMTSLLRLPVMRARLNSTQLRNYFLGILSFVPLMWMGACLMSADSREEQEFTALSTGAGLTVYMAAGLVDLIRARNVLS